MPAQGNGEGSAICTSTVLPISKSSTLPTGIHLSETLRNNGATTNPTIGTAMIIVHNPVHAIASLVAKVRREISSGGGCGQGSWPLFVFSFMAKLGNPTGQGGNEKGHTYKKDHHRSNHTPGDEG